MSEVEPGKDRGRLLPAVVTFVLVAGVVYVVGRLATALLKNVVLPLLALILGWVAARIVYKLRD